MKITSSRAQGSLSPGGPARVTSKPNKIASLVLVYVAALAVSLLPSRSKGRLS